MKLRQAKKIAFCTPNCFKSYNWWHRLAYCKSMWHKIPNVAKAITILDRYHRHKNK